MTPYFSPPLYTTWIQYTYSHREGGGGGGEITRGKVILVGAIIKKAGRKYQHD